VYGVSLDYILMVGYAVALAIIAFILEWAARYTHRRSQKVSTAGFNYHVDRDIWKCPREQHLFPVFSDSMKGVVIYRAPADACNSCRSKAACTDSAEGREIQRKDHNVIELGIHRFHRVISITLFVLATLILAIELFRTPGAVPRVALLSILTMFCLVVKRLWADLFPETLPLPRPARD
jgi:heme A synthase